MINQQVLATRGSTAATAWLAFVGGPAAPRQRRSNVELRTFSPGNMEAVFRLYGEVFGKRPALDFRARWRWSQEDNLYPDATLRWVLVSRARIVGFLATVPQPYWVNGQTVVAHTPCDYMVHPDFRFHGLKLMQACFNSCPNIVSCDNMVPTIRISQWLGARKAGDLVRYAKLLDLRGIRSRPWMRRLPGPLVWPASLALRARNRGHSTPPAGVTVLPESEFDVRFGAFAQRLRACATAMPARTSRFLRWRYGPDSPHGGREIGVATSNAGSDAGVMLGYVIFHRSSAPGRAGRILDLQYLPDQHPDVATALLAYAVRRLRQAGAWSVHYYRWESPLSLPRAVLEEQGFVARGRHELLVRMADDLVHPRASEAGAWSFAYGDSEAGHGAV